MAGTIEFLTHFYRTGTPPFRSLSYLSDAQAVCIMRDLYVEGSVIWERFKEPLDYLHARREIETWLRHSFIAKGGKPVLEYPIYFVIGSPKWIARMGDPMTLSTTSEIRVPFDIFEDDDISFTYPDSMVTFWLESLKDKRFYQPDVHGKVFTRSEIKALVAEKGLPDEGWETNVPQELAHYIEAQVWRMEPLEKFLRSR